MAKLLTSGDVGQHCTPSSLLRSDSCRPAPPRRSVTAQLFMKALVQSKPETDNLVLRIWVAKATSFSMRVNVELLVVDQIRVLHTTHARRWLPAMAMGGRSARRFAAASTVSLTSSSRRNLRNGETTADHKLAAGG